MTFPQSYFQEFSLKSAIYKKDIYAPLSPTPILNALHGGS